VRNKKAHEHSHYRFTGFHPASPRNGFNSLLRALPGDRAFLSPSSAEVVFRKLDAGVEASEPHDLTVRKLVLSSAALPASTASRTYVCDDRETPLCVGRDGRSHAVDLPDEQSEIFLQTGLDRQFTGKSLICPSGKISRPVRSSSESEGRKAQRQRADFSDTKS
jgi:hypothetical protein